MSTEVTRDVIVDLLPVYLSGEASADTKRLVETYMKGDPEFAQLIKTESKVVLPNVGGAGLKPESELAALAKTQKQLRRRAWHLGLAICFTLFSITFHIGPEGVHWTWHENHLAAVITTLAALFFWAAYYHDRRRLKDTGM
jgi:hypothetical protein